MIKIDMNVSEMQNTIALDVDVGNKLIDMSAVDIPSGAESVFVMKKDVIDALSPTSTNPVQSQAIYAALSNAVSDLELQMPKIYFGLTQYWNAEATLVGEKNSIYIYTDYQQKDGQNIAGIKVGDGSSYLIDAPFLDVLYLDHINDSAIHVTAEEKEFWNNKVTAYYSLTDLETMILTKEKV